MLSSVTMSKTNGIWVGTSSTKTVQRFRFGRTLQGNSSVHPRFHYQKALPMRHASDDSLQDPLFDPVTTFLARSRQVLRGEGDAFMDLERAAEHLRLLCQIIDSVKLAPPAAMGNTTQRMSTQLRELASSKLVGDDRGHDHI